MKPLKNSKNGKCSSRAYRLFADQLPELESTDALVKASIAISMHALDDVDPEIVCKRLQQFADRVCSRVHSRQISAMLSHLHDVLFEEEGFTGNTTGYYEVLNSFLPAVVESRKGIPVTLALVYKYVAERVGLEVEGINAPGHFLVRVRDGHAWMIVDPFDGGRALSRREASHRIAQVSGISEDEAEKLLTPTSHSQWLNRILNNVRHNLARENRVHDLEAMTELHDLLHESRN